MDGVKSNSNIYLWLLSGFSILMSVFAWFFFSFRNFVGMIFGNINEPWFNALFFYFLIALILSIIGLVLGIKQRKLVNYLAATLGIIIPIIAIVLAIVAGFTIEFSIILSNT